jgi:hypothetical protein
MTEFADLTELFKGRHFDREVVALRVRWYLRYKLSYRDLVEMMAERGLSMVHTTIIRRVHHYSPEFERRWNRLAPPWCANRPKVVPLLPRVVAGHPGNVDAAAVRSACALRW